MSYFTCQNIHGIFVPCSGETTKVLVLHVINAVTIHERQGDSIRRHLHHKFNSSPRLTTNKNNKRDGFPTQRESKAESISLSRRHQDNDHIAIEPQTAHA